jgi:hypothetical protein
MRLHYCDVCGKQVKRGNELLSVGYTPEVQDVCPVCFKIIGHYRKELKLALEVDFAFHVTELRSEHMRGDLPPARGQ